VLTVESPDGDKGVLFTRIAITDLQQTAPLPVTITPGTLIYNSNNTYELGYYYWNGDQWILLNASSGVMAKFQNSSRHADQNLHQNTPERVRVFGQTGSAAVFNDDENIYLRTGAGSLTILDSGRYQITANISFIAQDAPAQIEARIAINNIETGGYYRSTEMVPNTGSARGSLSITTTIDLVANDVVSINCKRSNPVLTGIVNLSEIGSSNFFIEKIL
jgi:hypothetical protein